MRFPVVRLYLNRVGSIPRSVETYEVRIDGDTLDAEAVARAALDGYDGDQPVGWSLTASVSDEDGVYRGRATRAGASGV